MILYVNQTTELPLLTLSLQRKRRKIDLSKFKGKKSTLRPTFTCSTQIPWFVLFFLQINTLKFLLLQLSTFKFLSISLCYLSKCKKFPNFPCRSINERNCLIRKKDVLQKKRKRKRKCWCPYGNNAQQRSQSSLLNTSFNIMEAQKLEIKGENGKVVIGIDEVNRFNYFFVKVVFLIFFNFTRTETQQNENIIEENKKIYSCFFQQNDGYIPLHFIYKHIMKYRHQIIHTCVPLADQYLKQR